MTSPQPLILLVFYFMEIWKDIKGYEGLYQVSNLGNVKSLKRIVKRSNSLLPIKEKLLIQSKDRYMMVNLSKNGKVKSFRVHVLVVMSFYGFKSNRQNIVDHIDNNKTNNKLSNLQIISTRENSSKDKDKTKTTSSYIGVYWNKARSKWVAMIRTPKSKNKKYLGGFKKEIDAHLAYQKELNKYN